MMGEIDLYTFSHKEIAEALIKKQNLHEGIWGVYVEFGIHAANAGPSEEQYLPTAFVPVLRLGLKRTDKITNLSADAAVVNPKPSS